MNYTLIRSRRKTMSLQITKDLQVVVRGPMKMKKSVADRFVESHRGWVEKHLKAMEEAASLRRAFDFSDGQIVYYLGRPLALEGREGLDRAIPHEGSMLVPGPKEDRKAALERFFREESRRVLPELTERYASLLELSPTGVRITSAATRWGSCSGRGSICYSWRLICLPPELVEYVIVHELCHLKHHNHSPEFHEMVERYLPDQARRRKALRDFQKLLPM